MKKQIEDKLSKVRNKIAMLQNEEEKLVALLEVYNENAVPAFLKTAKA